MSTVSVPAIPTVTIFVRHSKDCQHRDDYFYKKCKCREHLRLTPNGKQITASAKTRSWSEAEKAKRAVEDEFGKGNTSESIQIEADARVTLAEVRERFLTSKRHGDEEGPQDTELGGSRKDKQKLIRCDYVEDTSGGWPER